MNSADLVSHRQIMYFLSQPMYRYPRGCLGDVLNFHPLALKNLMPCLVHAYVRKFTSSSAEAPLNLILTIICRYACRN